MKLLIYCSLFFAATVAITEERTNSPGSPLLYGANRSDIEPGKKNLLLCSLCSINFRKRLVGKKDDEIAIVCLLSNI